MMTYLSRVFRWDARIYSPDLCLNAGPLTQWFRTVGFHIQIPYRHLFPFAMVELCVIPYRQLAGSEMRLVHRGQFIFHRQVILSC